MGFTVEKGSEKGSQKGFWEGNFQKVPRTPPWGVRPLRRAPYNWQCKDDLMYIMFLLRATLTYHKGRPTQTNHPQLAQTLSGQFVQPVPPFPCKTSRKETEEFAQTVCANYFYLGGWFLGGLPSLELSWTQTFFSQTFRAPPGYPGKIPGYPAQKVWIPWFRGTYQTFWPPPLHVFDPHPTGGYPDQKVWVWVPFSCLTIDSIKMTWCVSCFCFGPPSLTVKLCAFSKISEECLWTWYLRIMVSKLDFISLLMLYYTPSFFCTVNSVCMLTSFLKISQFSQQLLCVSCYFAGEGVQAAPIAGKNGQALDILTCW